MKGENALWPSTMAIQNCFVFTYAVQVPLVCASRSSTGFASCEATSVGTPVPFSGLAASASFGWCTMVSLSVMPMLLPPPALPKASW